MAGALHAAARWFAPQLASASPIYTQAAALAADRAGAMLIYFAAAFGIGGADHRHDPPEHQAGRGSRVTTE